MSKKLSLPRISSINPVNKRCVFLLMLEYHIFMQSLMKEVAMEARLERSKVIKRNHVKAVGKRMLRKFSP